MTCMGYGGTILIPWSPHKEPHIIRVIKSERMKWGAYSTHVRDEKCTDFQVEAFFL